MTLDQALAVAFIIAAVDALRTRYPKIDGFLVLLVACAAGVGLSFLDPAADVKATILRGILWGGAGSGFMHLAKTAGGAPSPSDEAKAVGPLPSIRPPGFSRISPMMAIAVGCFPLALVLYCCAGKQAAPPPVPEKVTQGALVMVNDVCVVLHDDKTAQDICAVEKELAPFIPLLLRARAMRDAGHE
jgi:hypothetical protein